MQVQVSDPSIAQGKLHDVEQRTNADPQKSFLSQRNTFVLSIGF